MSWWGIAWINCPRAIGVFITLLLLHVVLASAAEEGVVTRVLDGDTIEIQWDDDTVQRIRLIGINTAERSSKLPCARRWAAQATDVTRALTLGQRLWLERDVVPVDRFGRELAYVFIGTGDDPIFLNAALVQMGLAWVGEMGKNTRYKSVFRLLEAEAKAAHRGVWLE